MKYRPASAEILLLCFVLILPLQAHSFVGGQDRAPETTPNGILLNVVPSGLRYRVRALATRRPDLPASIVAALGNARVAREGLDYEFDLQDFIKENGLKPLADDGSEFAPFQLPMKTIAGEPVRLDIEVTAAQMCGERIARIPLAKLTATEMDVVLRGKQYRLNRPRSFILERMSLVDATFKNRLRTWELPHVTEPRGISSDAKTAYFAIEGGDLGSESVPDSETWPEVQLQTKMQSGSPQELLLAVTGGVYRFADSSEIPTQEKSELIQMHSPDPKDAYAIFKRFLLGDRTFIIRFEGPCT